MCLGVVLVDGYGTGREVSSIRLVVCFGCGSKQMSGCVGMWGVGR